MPNFYISVAKIDNFCDIITTITLFISSSNPAVVMRHYREQYRYPSYVYKFALLSAIFPAHLLTEPARPVFRAKVRGDVGGLIYTIFYLLCSFFYFAMMRFITNG